MLKVTCAIIIQQGKVFAARRGQAMKHPFKWEFPGGKLEEGETEQDGLLRELAEELDMNAVIIERLPSFVHHYKDFSIELIPFVCELPKAWHIPSEHDQTGWFTAPQLRLLCWTDADVPLMEYVIEKVLPRYI